MSFNHTLSAILRGQWMIERTWAEAHLPLVLSLLQGNPVSFTDRTGNQGTEKPFIIDPNTHQRKDMNSANVAPGSVGVIPVNGPITKYNGDCGEPGMIQRTSWLNEMNRRDNIGSIVLLLDTPGGEARATETFSTAIKRSTKPVLSYIDGMAASAGVYYTSASDEVYFGSKSDELGSIGSYVMMADFTGYFDKMGIKIHEIYAPQSTDKNKDYKDALKGEYGLIEEDLRRGVNDFINHVKTNRPGSAAFEKEWNSGKMFYANDAVKLGLADGIKSFDQVVSKAAWLGKRKK